MIINTTLLSDTILNELEKHHERVYRNSPPQHPIFPYVVYFLNNSIDAKPSEDFYIHIDVYDDDNKSVREMEGIADIIDNNINNKVINEDGINIHFKRESRQFLGSKRASGDKYIGGKKLITMRYNTRVYFK